MQAVGNVAVLLKQWAGSQQELAEVLADSKPPMVSSFGSKGQEDENKEREIEGRASFRVAKAVLRVQFI